MQRIVQNIVLGISLAAPLGPSGVAVIQMGFRRGFLSGFLTGVGVTLADATYLLTVYFGLSHVIRIPTVKTLIWGLGALVLLFLGYQSIRGAVRRVDLEEGTTLGDRHPVLVGYAVNISNPLSVLWWVGVFGSLLGESIDMTHKTYALLSSLSILIGIVLWHAMTSFLTHWGKRFLNETIAKVISVVAGIALIAFGIRFGYSAISTALQV